MLDRIQQWSPPENWRKITTIDAHTGGEPFRVITDGLPELKGDTILARRRYMRETLDDLRTALLWEPRGHADMYGCVVTPPVTPGADFGVLFLHNEGYSSMCGHGIIGIVNVVLETGMLPMVSPVTTLRIDAPAGLITAHARIEADRVRSVYFQNVPSFVLVTDERLSVAGIGDIRCDIAYGGAFYVYVDAADVGLATRPEDFAKLVETGMAIKRAVMAHRPVPHPFEADLSFLYGTIFTGGSPAPAVHSRHVCVFAEGEVDRCPTGTGVSGRLALMHARGEVGVDQVVEIDSIIGSRFKGRVAAVTTYGPHPAVVPEIEGTAHITGRHEFLIDPSDPLRKGFILR